MKLNLKDKLETTFLKTAPLAMIRDVQGKEGMVRGYYWRMFNRNFMIAQSETKWHSGDRFKRTPVFISTFQSKTKPDVPALFIWKTAFAVLRKAESSDTKDVKTRDAID